MTEEKRRFLHIEISGEEKTSYVRSANSLGEREDIPQKLSVWVRRVLNRAAREELEDTEGPTGNR